MIAIVCPDQLCGDAQLIAVFAYAALEYMGYIQLRGDLWYSDVFPLERERRGARRHVQFRNSCQQIQQLFGQSV